MFDKSVKITLGRVLGKATKLLIFIFFVGHSLTVVLILAKFDFVYHIYEETQSSTSVYIDCVLFIAMTTTTVGYGTGTDSKAENTLLVMCLEFTGIVFYGYAFQQTKAILSMTKSYDETIEERDDKLDKWLIDRQKHVQSGKNAKVIERTREAFEFVWKWDIENIFSHEFYYQISPELRQGIFEGPVEYVTKRFNSFFDAVVNKDLRMRLVHEMRPRE